jgi:alkylhydroperoxidase family enzyme
VSLISRVPYEAQPIELKDEFASRVARLGYLGEFFQVAAHQPEALLAFHRFTEALKAAADPSLAEVVALRAASATGNRYELHQHERLAARLGHGLDWIAAVESATPARPEGPLSEEQEAVRALVTACMDSTGAAAGAELAEVHRLLGDAPTVAIALLIARYAAHGSFANLMGLVPPVDSVFNAPDDIGET